MPPKRPKSTTRAPAKKVGAAAAASTSMLSTATALSPSPEKKKEEKDKSSHVLLVGFSKADHDKYSAALPRDWRMDETISPSTTHIVIKSLAGLKNSAQLLPVYYGVLKRDAWLLRPSFLPTTASSRRKSVGPGPLQREKEHAFDGKELDAALRTKAEWPSIQDVVRIKTTYASSQRPLFGFDHFQKVCILAGRSKESKQRREDLKQVMVAGGATVLEEGVLRKWKTKRGRGGGDGEGMSMVIIVNGEPHVASLGLDDETIREVLKARIPIFYEEFIHRMILMNLYPALDDLLLQSLVFVHEQWPGVDPDGRLQEMVLNEQQDEMAASSSSAAAAAAAASAAASRDTTPAPPPGSTARGRRADSRATSIQREGKREKKEEEKGRKRKGKKEREEEEATPPKQQKEEEAEGTEEPPAKKRETIKKSEERPSIPRGRPRKEKKEEKKEEEEEKEKEKEEEKKEEKEKVEEERMEEEDDIDPSLRDDDVDLLAEFEDEIRGGQRRPTRRTAREEEELREMREMRGEEEMERMGEDEEREVVTPEPIIFSQLDSQPPIEVPEELRRALEGEEEEKEELPSDKDDEEEEEVERGEKKIEKKVERKEGGKEERREEREEDEMDVIDVSTDEPRSLPPMGSVMPITIEETKECEACFHLGTQHLYLNKQEGTEIERHFSSPRLGWFDLIVDVKERMPWIREGAVLRPACEAEAAGMRYQAINQFKACYNQLSDDRSSSKLLLDVNSSIAMEMYEVEWTENEWRRPPTSILTKFLHEFAVMKYGEDLEVPERACAALFNALPVTLPSSEYGRYYWLKVMAGGDRGIKGRRYQVVEEMARRAKDFMYKALLTDHFPTCIGQFVSHYLQVDLLCAQTPTVDYERAKQEEEELQDSLESEESQRMTRGREKKKKASKKKNCIAAFPLVLLFLADLDDPPKRGLSEAAIVFVQSLMERVAVMKRLFGYVDAQSLQRALLCVLEAGRWRAELANAACSVMSGPERRRQKLQQDAAAAASSSSSTSIAVSVELKLGVQRAVRWTIKKGIDKCEIREMLSLSWLQDIVDTMEY